MAFKLTINKEYNHMYLDFIDAYWQLQDLKYDTETVYFQLQAYPSRESCYKRGEFVPNKLPIGGFIRSTYQPELYIWQGSGNIIDIFPNGIPISVDEQKAAVYNYIKRVTDIPFEDVFED